MRINVMVAALSALLVQQTAAAELFTVTATQVADEKAVFATVESTSVVPARTRIGGTVAELTVKEGDRVGIQAVDKVKAFLPGTQCRQYRERPGTRGAAEIHVTRISRHSELHSQAYGIGDSRLGEACQ